ncbi:MAG TPA: helicase, partial [Hyphomonadaceae bacterium]|nr:helicase [Hyphomonadaceae bacterium]
ARIKDEWMFEHVERLDRTEGDIDMLQQRLADIRTWTYAANRADWLENAETWRGRTREIEDRLSDALHQALMLRFVDRRTSALLKTLNSEEDAPAEIGPAGEVIIGGHKVGYLEGLVFSPDATGEALAGRALRGAALKSLGPVIEGRLQAIASAPDADFSFDTAKAHIVHACAPIARLAASADWRRPTIDLIGARDASVAGREAAQARLVKWFEDHSKSVLAAMHQLADALAGDTLKGAARGAAFQLLETGAAFDRRAATATRPAPHLTADDRAALNAAGVRSGRVATWLPGLLKPAAAALALALRAVHSGQPARPAPTQSSFALKEPWPEAVLWTAGYLRLGPRAVRADLAERLVSALSHIRRGAEKSAFAVPPELAAQIGCPIGDFPAILRSLGLKPAEKDRETGAVKLWRFAAARPPHAPRSDKPAPVPTGPFAALASLVAPQQQQRPRRRRKPRPRKQSQTPAPTPKAAS